MNLTTKGRYAVMAMVDLTLCNDGKPVTLADIEKRQGITTAYLEQLFSRMKRAGLVSSVRGPGGGYLLARPASDISIADIIMSVDESLKMTRCASQGCSVGGAKCLTHDLWDGLSSQIHGYLQSITLTDVCRKNGKKKFNFENEICSLRA